MFYIFIFKELSMSNITNNNFNDLNLKISKSEYWDLIISKNNNHVNLLDGSEICNDNLISFIDIDNPNCVSGNSLSSVNEYKWSDSFNHGLTLSNFGFNGVDNGGVVFDKATMTPNDFIELVTGSTINIASGDTRLVLNMISGNTKDYIYPVSFVNDINGDYIKLEGGFYQGFFKSGDEYFILPSEIQNEMSFEFVLKPDLTTTVLSGTLNEKYPNNKGIFFYMGTRSENKFWYDYFKQDANKYEISKTNQTSPLDLFTGNTIHTDDGFSIDSQNIYDISTDNKYLLFNRTVNGQVASHFNNDIDYHITGITQENLNYYLYLNRTLTGYTASHIDDLTGLTKPYNVLNDIVNNAIAFRIKDDGSIGYKMLNSYCVDEITDYVVDEEYSPVNVVRDNELTFINVRIIMDAISQCGNANRIFKLWFYVNGKLVFVSKELPELILRGLNDRSEKQESIPYNISFGGGSQGLSDMISFNSGATTQYLLPIEENFAGSFIGAIHKFKIYYGKMDYSKIQNNFLYQSNHIFNPGYIIPTVDFWISGLTLTYPETTYKRETGNIGVAINAVIKLNDVYNPITGYKLYCYPGSDPRIQLNGVFSISPSGGTIPEYIYNDLDLSSSGLTTVKYMIEVLDTYNNNPGFEKIKTIIFDNMIFYGTTLSEPTIGDDIRLLNNKAFSSETTIFTLETGAVDKIFVIAMPEHRNLFSVFDENAFMLNITHLFVKSIIEVPDAGGALNTYNVYTMKNAISYSRNHNFLITLN